VRLWKQAYAPGVDGARKARILYWIAHAQRAAGKSAEAERTLDTLARDHPLSLYTFMARPGAIQLLDGEKIVMDNAVIFPLYTQSNAQMISSKVTGIDYHPVALNRVYKDTVKSN